MSSYRRQYDVGLLDDLHNYFPELLYGPVEQFGSVSDVLLYMRSQVRRTFDLYSNGQRSYDRTSPPENRRSSVSAPLQATAVPAVPAVSGLPAVIANALRTPPARTSLLTPPRLARVNSFVPLSPAAYGQSFDSTINMIPMTMEYGSSPLDLISAFLNGNHLNANQTIANLPENFMEPVVVRPTPQEIEEGTTIEIVEVGDDENCAICQEVMEVNSEARSLVACDHRFHRNCIDTWFQQDVRCPTCRHDVRDPVVTVPDNDTLVSL